MIKKGTARERRTVNAHLFSFFGASLFGYLYFIIKDYAKLAKALGSEETIFLVVKLITNILTATKKEKVTNKHFVKTI